MNRVHVILAALIVLAGCTREVTGDVFVVTKGRENVRLALVEVAVLSEVEMTEHAATTSPY